MKYGGMRRFRLNRHVDVTGVSGTGVVAQGVVFSDGTVVIRWLGQSPTTTIHGDIESVEAVHCHGGRTVIRWEDPVCFCCAATFHYDTNSNTGYWCSACGANGGKEPYLETRPEPSLGVWSKAAVDCK